MKKIIFILAFSSFSLHAAPVVTVIDKQKINSHQTFAFNLVTSDNQRIATTVAVMSQSPLFKLFMQTLAKRLRQRRIKTPVMPKEIKITAKAEIVRPLLELMQQYYDRKIVANQTKIKTQQAVHDMLDEMALSGQQVAALLKLAQQLQIADIAEVIDRYLTE